MGSDHTATAFAAHTSKAGEIPKRREIRLAAALDVRILGMDAGGKAFHLPARTHDISASGARITGLAVKLNAGEIVGVQSNGTKARFKIAWVKPQPDGTCHAGLHCMEQGAAPWREHLQQSTQEDASVARPFECHGTAALQAYSSPVTVRGTVRDLSQTGCYLKTSDVVAEGEVLRGKFFFTGLQFDVVAQVRSSAPGLGMGLQWTDLGTKGHEKLSYILTTLAAVDSEAELSTAKAKLRVYELTQSLLQLRERLDSGKLLITPLAAKELDDALDRLNAALKAVQP